MEKKHNIALPVSLELTKGGSPKITDRDGFSIANLSNTVHKHRTTQGEFIVEACNNYERLQSENERMRDLLVKRKKYIGEFPLFVQSLYSDELDEINNILNPK